MSYLLVVKIDSRTSAVQGVEGDKILLGIVTFDREDTSVVPTVGVELGKTGSFANFVERDGGAVLDGTLSIVASAEIHPLGDADKSDVVDIVDLGTVKI